MVFWFMLVGIHSQVTIIASFGHLVGYGTILMITRLQFQSFYRFSLFDLVSTHAVGFFTNQWPSCIFHVFSLKLLIFMFFCVCP